jgi:hypothetical protein
MCLLTNSTIIGRKKYSTVTDLQRCIKALSLGGGGVKRQGHEADQSPPASAEVKNGGPISPFPNMPLHSA